MIKSVDEPRSTTTTLDGLAALVGSVLGTSAWMHVTQERVQAFADSTDDQQWIHVDVERAARESLFGGPVAHGYLTLSLIIPMWAQVTDASMGLNYGLDRVRSPAPVSVGAWVHHRDSALGRRRRGRGAVRRHGGGRAGRQHQARVRRRTGLQGVPVTVHAPPTRPEVRPCP